VQVVWEHSLGATTLQDVKNAIEYHAPAMFMGSTCLRFGWQVWLNLQPLVIIQFGQVALVGFCHPVSLPDQHRFD
jgi:hypothetical protein